MSNSQIIRISSDKFTTKVGENLTIDVSSSVIGRAVKSIRLLDAVIPLTFTNVPSNQNQFNLDDGSGVNTVTIPPHTFTPGNVIEVLKDQLDANSNAGRIFTVIYHKCEGTIEVKADGPFTLDFGVPNSAAPLLGFNPTTYTAVETPVASNIWLTQSNRRDQLSVDKFINITSNLITGVDQGIVLLDGQINPSINNILASIPISGTSGSNIIFSETADSPDIDISSSVLGRIVPPNTESIRTIQFGLSLDSGIPVDLSGSFWSARFLLKY